MGSGLKYRLLLSINDEIWEKVSLGEKFFFRMIQNLAGDQATGTFEVKVRLPMYENMCHVWYCWSEHFCNYVEKLIY